MTPSLNTQSAALIDRIINFHAQQSQEISLTKLYQLLYLIDFGHCALHGSAVSHFEYFGYKNELFAIGAADYIQLSSLQKQEGVQESAVAYVTPNTLSDTALNAIEKTLTRLSTLSEKEIHRIISYHPTWVVARDGKILDIKWAENCDFEWLDYFSNEMTREEYEQIEKQRRYLESSDRMKALEARLKKIKA